MTFEEFLKITYNRLKTESDDNFWIAESYLKPETHTNPKPDAYGHSELTFCKTWSLGGTSGDYNGNTREVSIEAEPDFPSEFDAILGAVMPNCTFMQYKKILNAVKVVGERVHRDYYGGRTTEGHKGFNVHKLYKYLSDSKYI